MAKFDWNMDDYEDERGSFEPVPPDNYHMKATKIDEKENKAGTGEYLNVEYTITRGEYKGRKVWHIFNVVHKSPDAERIGRQQVKSWAKACGKTNITNSDQLLEKEFEAKIGIEANKEYGDRNRIMGFIPAGGNGSAPAIKSRKQEDDEIPFDTPKAEKPKAEKPKETAPPTASRGKQANPWD